MKRLLLPILLVCALQMLGAEEVEPTYFKAGELNYQYFDGVNYYKGGFMSWNGSEFVNYPIVGDICIVAANPDYTGTDLVIPSTVNYNGKAIEVVGIAPEAFKGNQTIKSVSIPNTFPENYSDSHYSAPGNSSVDLCGADMFADCPNLTKVTFAEGMKYFKAKSPFRNTPIAELDIPQTMTELEGLLDYSAVTTIDIPEWVTKITFRGSRLTEIPALPGMTEVPQYCFMDCESLVDAILPVNAVTVGKMALYGCDNLKTLVVPDKVTTMGQDAVGYCPKLEKVTFGTSLDEFGTGVFSLSNAIEYIEFTSPTAPHWYQLGDPTNTPENAGIFPDNVYENALVVVPEGSLANYQKQGWFRKFQHAQDTPTGVNDIVAGEVEAPAEYFNLRGVQVSADTLVPGIYIVRRGNTTTKIAVR